MHPLPTHQSVRRSRRPLLAHPHWRGPAHRRATARLRDRSCRVFQGSSPITPTSPSSKAHQKSGPFPPPALPSFRSTMTLSDTHPSPTPICAVGVATSDPSGSPSITRITFPTCRVQYPGRPGRCACRLLPCLRGLPRAKGGSASASTLSRPARTSLTLRPIGSLGHPRRPLSRGFDPAGCPAKPLVSFRSNRQLSGWNLPP